MRKPNVPRKYGSWCLFAMYHDASGAASACQRPITSQIDVGCDLHIHR